MIKIVSAKIDDIKRCHQVDKSIHQKTSDKIFEKHQKARTFFIAKNEEKIIAYCYYKIFWDEEVSYIAMI